MTDHKNIAEALAAFQAELPTVVKSNTADVKAKTGASFKYQYADLTAVTEKVMPLLSKHGLAFSASPTIKDGRFVLAFVLMHPAGGFDNSIHGYYPLPEHGSPQDVGSAITYARRYALCAVTGVAPGGDDDDAGRAQDAHAKRPQKTPAAPVMLDQTARIDRAAKALRAAGTAAQIGAVWIDIEKSKLDGDPELVRLKDDLLSAFTDDGTAWDAAEVPE